MDCQFTEATGVQRLAHGTSGSYTFNCDSVGGKWFACSVGDACSKGLQRVRIHVTDPSKTAAIRSTIDPATGRNHVSMAEVFEQDLVNFAYKGHVFNTTEQADLVAAKLQSVLANSPQSCADWLVPADLTDARCKSWVYTDLGVIARSKPQPSLSLAEQNYNLALAQTPSFCLAESYVSVQAIFSALMSNRYV